MRMSPPFFFMKHNGPGLTIETRVARLQRATLWTHENCHDGP